MQKQGFLCLIPLLLVAVLLIGCGNSSQTPTAPSTVLPEEQSAASPTLAPSIEPTPRQEPESQSSAPSGEEATPTPSEPARSWDETRYHIGERATVCGTIVSTRYAREVEGRPTFLYIRNPYPAPHQFTVVIWGQNRRNFAEAPERYYVGKTICVRGLVTEDEGVPQIEVRTPSQIQEQ